HNLITSPPSHRHKRQLRGCRQTDLIYLKVLGGAGSISAQSQPLHLLMETLYEHAG
ncbi:MAG: hypothetical protein ACJA0F_002484, partial [Dinoroseobacter sp.]